VFALLAVVALAVPAVAGPPLLCHPFDIGNARSLPWDGTRAFWQGRADYRIENLVADTDALLTPSTPVIVRMETLRRAALYASADGEIATRLYGKFGDRLRASQKPGGRPDDLALFDFGYLTKPTGDCRTRPGVRRLGGSRVQKAFGRRIYDDQEDARAADDRPRDGVRSCADDRPRRRPSGTPSGRGQAPAAPLSPRISTLHLP
jgi:hypothetical protein